jgi:hypothetical protein
MGIKYPGFETDLALWYYDPILAYLTIQPHNLLRGRSTRGPKSQVPSPKSQGPLILASPNMEAKSQLVSLK